MLHKRLSSDQPIVSLLQEEVKSEYLRSMLLIILFTALLAVSLINDYFFVDKNLLVDYGGESLLGTIILFIGVFITYQLLSLYYLRKQLRLSQDVAPWYKVGHTLVELSFPSVVMYYIMKTTHLPAVIDSPIVIVYFLFITLSILHLDYRVNVFAGFLAGGQYAVLTYYAFTTLNPGEEYERLLPANIHYVRSVLLVFSGGAAAFVSVELKKRMRSTFDYLEAKNQLEFLFGQQVSREVSEAIIREKGAIKKVEATVMFLDIRNFTVFADGHTAEEVIDYQNKFLGPVIDIINVHQGVVFQILGDGLMACFGSPVENVLHADMAFQAGISILRQVKRASIEGTIPPTSIGIGLHCGLMVAGNIGSENRKQFSISGSPVIVASRIEQLNKKYDTQFLISGQVHEKITPGKIEILHLAEEPLKGIGRPVDIFKVLAV